jgi:hypothetical protein
MVVYRDTRNGRIYEAADKKALAKKLKISGKHARWYFDTLSKLEIEKLKKADWDWEGEIL